MDTIKKYFIQSVVDNEAQLKERNNKLDAYLNNRDETQRDKVSCTTVYCIMYTK